MLRILKKNVVLNINNQLLTGAQFTLGGLVLAEHWQGTRAHGPAELDQLATRKFQLVALR